MQLARPEWLWCLAVFPLLGVRLVTGRSRRARDWKSLGQGGRPAGDGSALWLAASACLCLALAGPRWGPSDQPPLPPGHDVVIAVDVSRSMAALDAVPDRLGLAVESACSLVKALGQEEGDRVAVVAFAGRGVLRCPLTRDLGAAVEALRALKPGQIRPGGSDLGSGLVAALDAFGDDDRAGGRSLVLFSDGEDLAEHWRPAAGRLREQGVVVHTVAVGDSEAGHPVPSRPGRASPPLLYHGSVVLSRRSDQVLSAIARETGGAFVPLGLATTDLGRLYQTRIEPGARVLRDATSGAEPAERFPLFLAASLALALAASWPGRPGHAAWKFGITTLAVTLSGAGPGEGPAAVVARGRAAYEAGRHDEALGAFRQALRLSPRNPVTSYDVAAALFQLDRFEEAQALYEFSRERADDALRVKIDYALGNTLLARGDFASAIRHYDDCLASRLQGPDPDRVRRDAAVNRRFVEEQVRRSLASPETEGGRGSDKSPGRSSEEVDRPENLDKNQAGPGGGAPQPGEGTPQKAPPVQGGAGDVGRTSPRSDPPEAQLSEALKNARDAKRRRIDETPEANDRDDRKDW